LLMLAIILTIVRRYGRKLKNGDVFLMYLIAYPLGRLWVESFRWDAWTIGGVPTAQIISIASIVLAGLALYVRHRPGSTPANPSAVDPDPLTRKAVTPVRAVPSPTPVAQATATEAETHPVTEPQPAPQEVIVAVAEEPAAAPAASSNPGNDALPA